MPKVSLPEFAALCGRSYPGVWYHADKGRLGSAWDGKVVDTEHPDAVAFRAREKEKHPFPDPVEVACAVCGKHTLRHKNDQKRRARHYCSRECFKKARYRRRACERCGKEFVVRDYDGRFCSVDGAAVDQRIEWNEGYKWKVNGALFTMAELEKASGLGKKVISERIRTGMPILEAITMAPQSPGPKNRKGRR